MNKVYKDLMSLPGVSGNENMVRKYMIEYMKKYPNYQIRMDNLGSVFAIKKSKNENAKTVMIAGHMDEVGFMVSSITDMGHIKIQPLGGFLPEVLISQVLNVYVSENKIIKGIIGSLPPHLKKNNDNDIKNFLLDIGSNSKEETLSYGVRPGQMVLFEKNFTLTYNKKRVISKAVDNRYGCALALEVIKEFSEKDLDVNLVIGATVQEEVGLRGAQTATNMFEPDIFIALDASPVNDLESSYKEAGLGKGFLLRLYDPRNVMHQGLLKYFVELANKNKIKYQDFISKGGTDAAKALDQLDGVLATTIGLPARYIHSSAALMDLEDLKNARKMVFKLIESLNTPIIQKLKEGYFD